MKLYEPTEARHYSDAVSIDGASPAMVAVPYTFTVSGLGDGL